MRNKIADFILAYRLYLIIALFSVTAFMGYVGMGTEMSYQFIKIVPDEDPDMQYFKKFKETFGQDDNIFVIGMQDSSVFEIENFEKLKNFSNRLKQIRLPKNGETIQAIAQILSLPDVQTIVKNTEEKKFEPQALFEPMPQSQAQLDSLLKLAADLKFYEGQLLNPNTGATLMALSFAPEVFGSRLKHDVVSYILDEGERFEAETGIKLHYGGVPYVRSVVSQKVKAELNIFLVISLLVTAAFLFLMFRSFTAVIFPLIVIGMVVIWTLGTLAIFDYKITLLTGLLPPILVVIGVPNCVYLLNQYHQQFKRLQNQKEALRYMIIKIGVVTLITNTTTAIGFLVLTFTDISILKEFGTVAGLNIFATFIISIIFIPAAYSYLPAPSQRHTKHLEFPLINRITAMFIKWVFGYRTVIYIITACIIGVTVWSATKVSAVSFMVDDLPSKSSIRKDLAFFETHFKGVMPLEIMVDTGMPKGIRKMENLRGIDSLERFLAESPHLSAPISMVRFIKAANQAYFGGNVNAFQLPGKREAPYVYRYLQTDDDPSGLLASFVDTAGQKIRLSLKVADLGSIRMDSLVSLHIKPHIDSIFQGTDMTAQVTGTTPIFIKGNEYLIRNLGTSLLLACLLVSIIMAALFKSGRIMLIAIIPNLIPLVVTAGLMGLMGVPLKPSTALIFSIAFGISVDDSIHFLAKYRQEMIAQNFNQMEAIAITLRETGKSMIYTSIILFAGFIIFVGSEFGGTVALGALTSTTLLVAMFTNLILLPSLLLTFKGKVKRIANNTAS
ncbi:MAG: MMPL family transporter [Bernardetiaceae bacterium]|nr:MMPL family transporter [Bernardetiaceae bacterium]